MFRDGVPVGWVTAAAWSPSLERGIGYVRFTESGDWLGETVSVKTSEGATVPASVVPLPFLGPEKRIPRGLDTKVP